MFAIIRMSEQGLTFYRKIAKGKDCNAMKKKIIVIVAALVLALASTFVLKDNTKQPCLLSSAALGVAANAVQSIVETAEPTDLGQVAQQFAEGVISSLEESVNDPIVRMVSICTGVISDTTADIAIGLD